MDFSKFLSDYIGKKPPCRKVENEHRDRGEDSNSKLEGFLCFMCILIGSFTVFQGLGGKHVKLCLA